MSLDDITKMNNEKKENLNLELKKILEIKD